VKESMKKELDTLKQMVLNWRESYLGWIEDDNNEWLIGELREEIATYMEPQVRRFQEMKFLTTEEVYKFWTEIGKSVNDFAKDVMEGKKREKEKVEIDADKLLSQFNVHMGLIEGNHGGYDFTIEQKIKLADIAVILVPALVQKLCKCRGKNDAGRKK